MKATVTKSSVVNRMPWSQADGTDPARLLACEWLATNGLGGYASGTASGMSTRRYHGLLIAALPAPLGRMMMFNHLVEQVRLADGSVVPLTGDPAEPKHDLDSAARQLSSFELDAGLPVWRYGFGTYVLEKRLLMPHHCNTVHVIYRLQAGDAPIRLRLRPGLHFRAHEAPVGEPDVNSYSLHTTGDRIEITTADHLTLRMQLRDHVGALVLTGGQLYAVEYTLEAARGYAHLDKLWSPGYFRAELAPGESVALSASTESWETLLAVSPDEALSTELARRQRLIDQAPPAARSGTAAELVLGADEFIIAPTTRTVDEARARAIGEELRSVIAGYHWFTDWGRDTMISLEGLTLATGRYAEAGHILRTFGHYVADGLIPNLFPEGQQAGLYHTADATLWFFHALDRYLDTTGDEQSERILLPTLADIVAHHLRGTRFGIHVDPADGLLSQGAAGYQLTWMDAKVDDWVVTPRRGKAVEINALWYNALRVLEKRLRAAGQDAEAETIARHAEKACQSFNVRFWNEERGYLFDVVDGENGNDPALRPNQLFAISLPNPVLAENRWPAVVDVAREQLLTPVGLRSLGPHEPDYKPRYSGDLRSRDAAYHQGTVWGWLIGPFVDAWLKVHPQERQAARQFLEGFVPHLSEAGIGSISEIFDADPPFRPRGCIAQAWSVAEVLRCWLKTELDAT